MRPRQENRYSATVREKGRKMNLKTVFATATQSEAAHVLLECKQKDKEAGDIPFFGTWAQHTIYEGINVSK